MPVFTVYHGTNYKGASGIGFGDWNNEGYVAGADIHASKGVETSWLGRGIYASPSYFEARAYGEYVYLVEFHVERIKVVTEWDYHSNWRSGTGRANVDGIFMPAHRDGGQLDPDGEGNEQFCFRGSKLGNVWLVRHPDGQVWNSRFHEPEKLTSAMSEIVNEVSHLKSYIIDNFHWQGAGGFECSVWPSTNAYDPIYVSRCAASPIVPKCGACCVGEPLG